MGKTLVVIGVSIAAIGALVWALGDRLSPLGRLPGDIRIGDRVFIPLTTSLLLSLILTLLLNLIARLFRS